MAITVPTWNQPCGCHGIDLAYSMNTRHPLLSNTRQCCPKTHCPITFIAVEFSHTIYSIYLTFIHTIREVLVSNHQVVLACSGIFMVECKDWAKSLTPSWTVWFANQIYQILRKTWRTISDDLLLNYAEFNVTFGPKFKVTPTGSLPSTWKIETKKHSDPSESETNISSRSVQMFVIQTYISWILSFHIVW